MSISTTVFYKPAEGIDQVIVVFAASMPIEMLHVIAPTTKSVIPRFYTSGRRNDYNSERKLRAIDFLKQIDR